MKHYFGYFGKLPRHCYGFAVESYREPGHVVNTYAIGFYFHKWVWAIATRVTKLK